MEGGAWWATVRGVPKSQAKLSYFTFLPSYILITWKLDKSLIAWSQEFVFLRCAEHGHGASSRL